MPVYWNFFSLNLILALPNTGLGSGFLRFILVLEEYTLVHIGDVGRESRLRGLVSLVVVVARVIVVVVGCRRLLTVSVLVKMAVCVRVAVVAATTARVVFVLLVVLVLSVFFVRLVFYVVGAGPCKIARLVGRCVCVWSGGRCTGSGGVWCWTVGRPELSLLLSLIVVVLLLLVGVAIRRI